MATSDTPSPSTVTNGALHRSEADQDHSPGSASSTPGNGTQANSESIPAHFAPLSLRLVLIGTSLGSLIGAAAVLGAPFFFELLTTSKERETRIGPQFWVYLFSWGVFHILEFVVTAHWNPTRLMRDSFLLQNGWNYHAAHAGAILEFLIESYLFPHRKQHLSWINYSGFLLVLLGQWMRSLSMIQAANNFSHQVASKKRQDHVLVKEGLYSIVRHPSYSGFFTWAVGTQILLGNPLGTPVFVAVLWKFFSSRIDAEEEYLVSFFGQEYRDYKKKVWSGIPLVH